MSITASLLSGAVMRSAWLHGLVVGLTPLDVVHDDPRKG